MTTSTGYLLLTAAALTLYVSRDWAGSLLKSAFNRILSGIALGFFALMMFNRQRYLNKRRSNGAAIKTNTNKRHS